MRTKDIVVLLSLLLLAPGAIAQRDLLGILEAEQREVPQYVLSTFKATRIAIGHSLETRKKGVLEIMLSNRYCNTPTTYSQSLGPEKVNTRIALEYGIGNRLSAGAGGSTWNGLFDGYLKYRLIRQRSDGAGAPLGVTLFQGGSYFSESLGPYVESEFSDRMSFTTQLLLARKLGPNLSFQLAPTYVRKGLRYSPNDPRDQFALGFGARYRFLDHASLVAEYYALLNSMESYDTYGPLAIGVNWDVGNLLLQFTITNATHFADDAFISGTDYNFDLGNTSVNFGLSVTYSLHLKRHLKGLEQGSRK